MVLGASRWLGWVLATVLVASCVFMVGTTALQALQNDRTRGDQHARSFIAKVRACHRARPHPSWDECERRVQDAE